MKTSVTDVAIDRLKDKISSGELRPGQKLPREQDLAVELGLSRSSLREAVRALSLIRVLDVRQGDGTYVTQLAPSALMESTGFLLELVEDRTVLEAFEIRRLLEPVATALAAARITDDQLDELQSCMERIEATQDLTELVDADMRFHDVIARAAGNELLVSLLQVLSGRTARARIWHGMSSEGALERTRDDHRAILHAVRARDPELSRSVAAVHVARGEAWLREGLRSATDSSDPA